MDGANKQGGEREELWRREMERKMGEWEKRVQRFEESRQGGNTYRKQIELKNFQGKRGD